MVSKFEARKFKLKIKITMIDISCKFYVGKNDVTYTYILHITLVVAIIRQRKLLLTCKKLPTIALSHRAKTKIINMRNSLCLFVLYKFLMENKNIRKFCVCKPFKNSIESHQNFTGSYKTTYFFLSIKALDEDTQNIK